MVLPDEPLPKEPPLAAPAPILRYGIAVAMSVLALWVRALLAPYLKDRAPWMPLVFAIVLSAVWAGRGAGVFSTLICAVAGGVLFARPALASGDPKDPAFVELLVFLAQGLIISWLVGRRWAAEPIPESEVESHPAAQDASPSPGERVGEFLEPNQQV